MQKICLIRYDTENDSPEKMEGFLEKAVAVHREHRIPVTLFCKGRTVEKREEAFRAFFREVRDDPLFDIQDHSYSHIGLGYEAGKDVEVLRADYERSLAVHERVFGVRPVGVSICGTGGVDGKRLSGFDATSKGRAEFEMIATLGIRMINTHLAGTSESREFSHYGALGHPEIMGFPSAYSDTSWMHRHERGDPLEFILSEIEERGSRGEPMPVMLHDWVAWNSAADRELTHVKQIADKARECGYELKTHLECLQDQRLWK